MELPVLAAVLGQHRRDPDSPVSSGGAVDAEQLMAQMLAAEQAGADPDEVAAQVNAATDRAVTGLGDS